MRFRLLLAIFAVVAAACGGTAEPAVSLAPTEAPAESGALNTDAPDNTAAGTSQSTEPPTSDAPTTERSPTEGPPAPAINAVLSDGTSFSLADEANPVYLIFWAEW